MRADGFQRSAILRTMRCCIVLFCLAFFPAVSAPPASAESPVYVDGDGLCGGNTPCLTSIQAAVNLATDPDGPLTGAAAQVIVYPGYYGPSVDLSSMGCALAAAPGDIFLRAADPDDRPLILLAFYEPAFHTYLPFPGHVNIDGFHIVPVGFDYANGISLDHLAGSATLRHLNVEGVPGTGIDLSAIAGTVTIEHVAADLNGTGGIHVDSSGDIYIHDCTASATLDGSGIFASTDSGTVTISKVFTDHNAGSGVDVAAAAPVTMTNVFAGDNGGNGVSIVAEGTSDLERVFARDNAAHGIFVDTGAALYMSIYAADRNGDDGVHVTGTGPVTMNDIGNTFTNEGNGIAVDVDGDVTIADLLNGGNAFYGMSLSSGGKVTIDRSDAISNQTSGGIWVPIAPLGLTISNTLVSGNAGHGFLLGGTGVGPIHLQRVTATGNDLIGIRIAGTGTDVVLDDVFVAGNDNNGLVIGGPVGPTYRISGSVICSNDGTGLRLESDISVDAEGNWWGDINGPAHPANPGGGGDEVIDANSPGGAGTVDLLPWIDTVVDAIAHPPFAGLPVEISLRLSDAAHAVFLGVGPGSPVAAAPISVSTTNGSLTRDGIVFGTSFSGPVNNPDGLFTVSWIPGATGPATVEFAICGHQVVHTFEVDLDCNANLVPDSDELTNNDCNQNLVPDGCEPDCNDNGLADDCDLGLLTTPIPISENLPIPNEDPAGVTTLFDVAEHGVIADLDLGLKIDHTLNGDLSVTLSHAATTVNLFDHPGYPGLPWGSHDNGFDIVLDDDAPEAVQTAYGRNRTLYGTYHPYSPLAAFNGRDMSGPWTLTVIDDRGSDTGTLLHWTLVFVTETGAGMSDDCNNNTVPDDCDIAAATSADLNANGLPDECESLSLADLDLDGHVNLTDFLTFAACFAGPNAATPPDGCAAADFARADLDDDGDVDLGDFMTFATAFSG